MVHCFFAEVSMRFSIISLFLVFSMISIPSCTSGKNTSQNETCGNGVIDPGERCDGSNLAGQTCIQQGFAGGVLQCNANCMDFDTSWCETATNNANNTNNTNNTNNWTPPTNSRVYVNTKTQLFYIDPGESDEMVLVGTFAGLCTSGSSFYDIALDENRNMVGIAEEGLYRIDSETAECTMLRQFPAGSPHFFALSYVKGVDTQFPNRDVLMGATVEDGEWVEINPYGENLEAIFIHHGYYDHPDYRYVSSGDIVSVQTGPAEYHTYATVKCGNNYQTPGCESDLLAEIDPVTGDARIIGLTGYQQIFALGYWGNKVYGFTKKGEYILIDVDTAQSTLISSDPTRDYWGAGNTTRPYVVD